MQLTMFNEICERLAESETRSFIAGGSHLGFPLDEYGLLEAYCTDPECDCRRVMLTVVSRSGSGIEATIGFGFDRKSLMGPGIDLDPFNMQGPYAEQLLKHISEVVLSDEAYVNRLRQHYQITKQIMSGELRPEDAPESSRLTGYVLQDVAQVRRSDNEPNDRYQPPMSRAERREAERMQRKAEKKMRRATR